MAYAYHGFKNRDGACKIKQSGQHRMLKIVVEIDKSEEILAASANKEQRLPRFVEYLHQKGYACVVDVFVACFLVQRHRHLAGPVRKNV